MTYYTVCPDCGYKLLKASDGSNIEIYCPKYKAKLLISVNDDKVLIQYNYALICDYPLRRVFWRSVRIPNGIQPNP
ncbi:MAG: hypothetical protein HDR55_02015 [Treponema sp.]|nr:hypothetical protein [Treponema sp.]